MSFSTAFSVISIITIISLQLMILSSYQRIISYLYMLLFFVGSYTFVYILDKYNMKWITFVMGIIYAPYYLLPKRHGLPYLITVSICALAIVIACYMMGKLGIDISITVHTPPCTRRYNYSIGFHEEILQQAVVILVEYNNNEVNNELQEEEQPPEEPQLEQQAEQREEQQHQQEAEQPPEEPQLEQQHE